MMRENANLSTQDIDVRTWTHGEFPMPDWVPPHMAGGMEPNGTFALSTGLGRARVHLGNDIIERRGSVWVRAIEEASKFVDDLKATAEPIITNVGPGKVRQFGVGRRTKSKARNSDPKKIGYQPHYSPPIGSQPSIEWIHLVRLSIDDVYQRSTDNEASRRLIASIAENFDWRLCAPLVVSRRADETLTIIDGQHRWMAASQRNDIPQLPCCVFRYESTQEEARMFILANRARKPMNRLDDFFAALAAADEDALEIQQLVMDAGLKVARNTSSTSWRPREIVFTAAISSSIRKFGPAITSAVLTNMAVAFPDQKLNHGGAIFGALVRIMSRPPAEFDPDRLVSVLQSRTADEWGAYLPGLKGGDARAMALRDAILEAYDTEVSVSEPKKE
jgi:ParB-like nuclease domain